MPTIKHEYPYITVWGKMMGSYDYYIESQIRRARETNAPSTAIYEQGRKSGQWSVVEEVENRDTRLTIEQLCRHFNVPIPQWRDKNANSDGGETVHERGTTK